MDSVKTGSVAQDVAPAAAVATPASLTSRPFLAIRERVIREDMGHSATEREEKYTHALA